jgi:hypothetical protein
LVKYTKLHIRNFTQEKGRIKRPFSAAWHLRAKWVSKITEPVQFLELVQLLEQELLQA